MRRKHPCIQNKRNLRIYIIHNYKNLLLHERVKVISYSISLCTSQCREAKLAPVISNVLPSHRQRLCTAIFDRRIVYIAKSFHAQWVWRHSLTPLNDNYPHREGKWFTLGLTHTQQCVMILLTGSPPLLDSVAHLWVGGSYPGPGLDHINSLC